MKFSKKHNIICFSQEELHKFFKDAKVKELHNEMKKQKISFDDLRDDPSKMDKLASVIGERGAQDRDEHEIFASLFMFKDFYKPGSEVCFEVSGFNPDTDKIASLDDLVLFRHKVNTSDFGILAEDGVRMFQLKRYRGEINTSELFKFIKEKVEHYGNNLGDTNLLVILQPQPHIASDLNFHELHERMKSQNWKFPGEIRIAYNQNNQKQVMIQVYPGLSKSKVLIRD